MVRPVVCNTNLSVANDKLSITQDRKRSGLSGMDCYISHRAGNKEG